MVATWAKYCYTAILCINHMAYAMSFTAIGSVLTEMVDILQTTTDKMTLFTTFTSTGFVIGSLFCFLLKYLNRQSVWIVYVVLISATLTLVPHSPNLASLYGCAIGIGVGCGVLNTIINVWIIEMWKEKSPSVLQIPGLTFGIGTILSPLIIKPFLRPRNHPDCPPTFDIISTMATALSSTNSSITGHSSYDYAYNEGAEECRRSLIKTPFYILGVIQLLFPVLMSAMFIVNRYKYTDESVNEKTSMSKEYKLFDRQRQQRKLMIILFSVLLGVFNIYEATYYTFAPTYFQYSPLRLTETEAADMITAFTIPYTVFRGISCLIAFKVLPKYMLSGHYLISVIGIICLVIAQNNKTMLWVSNIIIGIGVSAIMQTSFAFVGQHIRMTDTIGTILVIFLGTFNMAPPYVLGLFIKEHSESFILVEGTVIIVSIALFTIIMLFITKYEAIERIKQGNAK